MQIQYAVYEEFYYLLIYKTIKEFSINLIWQISDIYIWKIAFGAFNYRASK